MARRSGIPLVGSRVTFESYDERYPEMASESLWDEPPQRRAGVVLSIDEVIYGMKHYVIVMDEPVNSRPREIGEDLVEKYVAPTIDSPKRHIILVQANKVQDSVKFVVESRRGIPASTLMEYPSRMYRCRMSKLAERASNLLMTCETHSHMMCKRDLIPWDDKYSRPLLSRCGKFTEQMKSYCHSTMGYEPTYIPTRVLLGYKYWCTEDQLKAIREFCEYDLWVCYVCRFDNDQPRGPKRPNENVKFGFIHQQLFPEGAEEEAGRIMTAIDRDELSQFGRAHDDDMLASEERFLQLNDDLVLHVLNPVTHSVHRVSCYKNWNLGTILRETLKVSQIAYNADIVIYKVEPEGWEVELCDLRLVDLDDSSRASRSPDMLSIRDLHDGDVLVIRMRSLHKIGARQRLPGLGITDPTLGQEIGKIAENYGGFRRIGGDGNCYYRAIAYGALEKVVLDGDVAKFDVLRSIFMRVVYKKISDKESHEELLSTLELAAAGKAWRDVEELQSSFLTFNSNFDFALVSACRHLVSMYLIENQATVTEGGLSLKDTFIEADEGMDMATYCDMHINEMGRDAEGPYIELGILPSLLQCRCVIFSLDLRDHSDMRLVCPFDTLASNGATEPLAVLHILLRPGHYDLLYTPDMEFPAPRVFQEVSEREDAIHSQRAEEKVSASTGPGTDSGNNQDFTPKEDHYSSRDDAKAMTIPDAKHSSSSSSVTVGSPTDGPESSPHASAARKDYDRHRTESKGVQRGGPPVRRSTTSKVKAVSMVQEVVPDITDEQAVRYLEAHDYNVEASINAFLTGEEVQDRPQSGRNRDDKDEDMILDGSTLEKRRVFNRLKTEMPEIDEEVLRDAVDVGDCCSKDEVQKYVEKMRKKENSDRGGGDRWLPSFTGFLGRGRK